MAVFQGFMDLERFVRREYNKKTSNIHTHSTPSPMTIDKPSSPIINQSLPLSPNDSLSSSPFSTSQNIYSLEDIIAALPPTPEPGQPTTPLPEASSASSHQPEPSKPEVINLDSLLSGLEKTWNIQAPNIPRPRNPFPSTPISRPGRSAKARGIAMIAGGTICLGGLLYFYIITTNPLLFEDKTTITQATTESSIPSIADSLSQPLNKPKKTMTALTPFDDAVGANDAETTINVLDIMDLLDKELSAIQSHSGTEKRLQSTATMLLKNLHTARTVLDESPHNPNRDEIKDILTRIQTIYHNTIKTTNE